MSQKTDLQASNTDLQVILDMVNSLPDKEETKYVTSISGNKRAITKLAYLAKSDAGFSSKTLTTIPSELSDAVPGTLLYAESSSNIYASNGTIVAGTKKDGWFVIQLSSSSNTSLTVAY